VNDADITCAACGRGVLWCDFSGLYNPAGTDELIPYVLCQKCSSKMRSGRARLRNKIFNLVELRVGPTRGRA